MINHYTKGLYIKEGRRVIIQSRRVFIAGQFIPAQVIFDKGVITDIAPCDKSIPDVDFENKLIVPGFIDIHTHGMLGYSADELSPEGLIRWQKTLPSEGVTSFLPTTTSQSKNTTIKALKNIAHVKSQRHTGAEIIGVHQIGRASCRERV